MSWKHAVSAMLVFAFGFTAYDALQFGATKLAEIPLGAYPIPFVNGVKESLFELPEDAHRKFAAKIADAKTWISGAQTIPPVIAGVT